MNTPTLQYDRESSDKLESQFRKVSSISYLQELLNALPNIATILNDKRQIIYSNETLLKQISIKDFRSLLGRRTGEVINCIHSDECAGGCGTSESCKACGALNAIIKSMKDNRKVSEECYITAIQDNEEVSYEFEATASPFTWEGENFTIFSLIDISSAKRRRMLERIFFHDILNTAGNIRNLAELIPQLQDGDQVRDLIQLMKHLSDELVEEIEAQKQLTSAETGELKPKSEPLSSIEILDAVTRQFSANPQKKQREVIIDKESQDIALRSDRLLLIRVLKNMLKNAIEASLKNDPVVIGVYPYGSNALFRVHNSIYIPRKVQLQVFKRNFSTKGSDRGLGTYSMKLLGEKYLRGKVYFESAEEEGTTFYFELPPGVEK